MSLAEVKSSIIKILKKFARFSRIFKGGELLLVLLILSVLFSALSPVFLTASNIINIARQVSIIGIACVGLSILMISGGIDISIGSQLAFSGLLLAIMLNQFKLPVSLALIIVLVVAGIIGIINTTLVTKIKIPPLIATLAMMSVIRGFGYIITQGYPIYDFPNIILKIGKGNIGFLPVPVLIMIIVFVIGFIFLNQTYIGRYFYALGGNPEASRLSGINIGVIRYISYCSCSVLTAIAGIILLGRINSAQPSAGVGFEFDVITAVVLGGVSISGGVGKIFNVLLGVLIIGVVNNGLVLLNIHDYYQTVIKGAILLFAVGLDNITKERS